MHEVQTLERHGPRPIPIFHRTGRMRIVPSVRRERSRRSRCWTLVGSTLRSRAAVPWSTVLHDPGPIPSTSGKNGKLLASYTECSRRSRSRALFTFTLGSRVAIPWGSVLHGPWSIPIFRKTDKLNVGRGGSRRCHYRTLLTFASRYASANLVVAYLLIFTYSMLFSYLLFPALLIFNLSALFAYTSLFLNLSLIFKLITYSDGLGKATK